MTNPAKDEFIELLTTNGKVKGLDELTSRLNAILYIETNPVSLEELAKRTGYSLSAVSTAMKFMERVGLTQRMKKPGSRKVYFYMKKDMMAMFLDALKKQQDKIVTPSIEKLPGIIDRYKLDKSEESEIELETVKKYYKQVNTYEKILKKMIGMLEVVKKLRKR